jgi:hypothetical protein
VTRRRTPAERRAALRAARASRDLRRGGRVVADARTAREGRAVRLAPGEYLGGGPGRTGRFGDVDPLSAPRIWGLWEWVGFLFWAGVTAEAGRRAWKRHGGPTGGEERGPAGT